MDRLASQLPEYETVMAMTGVGKSMGPQLMAEIGDIRRFAHQKSLIGFAGTDPIKSEGKKYHVYMTAGMTKFLRIYYGKVRDCLKEKDLWNQPPTDEIDPA